MKIILSEKNLNRPAARLLLHLKKKKNFIAARSQNVTATNPVGQGGGRVTAKKETVCLHPDENITNTHASHFFPSKAHVYPKRPLFP